MANSLSDCDWSPAGLAWTRAEQIAQFTAECAARADLYELAAEYERRCEAFDRTVCTGGIGRDGSVQPATPHERGAINRNAAIVWAEIEQRAAALGYTRADLKREIARQDR